MRQALLTLFHFILQPFFAVTFMGLYSAIASRAALTFLPSILLSFCLPFFPYFLLSSLLLSLFLLPFLHCWATFTDSVVSLGLVSEWVLYGLEGLEPTASTYGCIAVLVTSRPDSHWERCGSAFYFCDVLSGNAYFHDFSSTNFLGFCCATFSPETAERLQVINVLLLIVMESLLTSIS